MTKPEYIIKVGNVTVMTWEQYKLLKKIKVMKKDKQFTDWWSKEGQQQFNENFNNDHIPWGVMAVNGIGSQLDVTGTEPDPLDFKPILNAYGERMHHLNGIVKVYQRKLDKEQMKFTGVDTEWIYELI